MKYDISNILGDAGEHLVAAKIIKLFGYPFRLTNIDIGIDAEIELIDINNKSTGQFIKCQIKTTTLGNNYLYIDGKHISYWNTMNIPVVIFLVHIDNEQIYWHCVENINNYKKLKSGYKISFDPSEILKKSNKERFDEIAIFPLKGQIANIYDECFSIVKKDNTEFLDNGNYDIVTFEEFVYNSNKIRYKLKRVDRLIRKNRALDKVRIRYFKEIEIIDEYLNRIDEEKSQILMDSGDNYFDHLDSENFDWD